MYIYIYKYIDIYIYLYIYQVPRMSLCTGKTPFTSRLIRCRMKACGGMEVLFWHIW